MSQYHLISDDIKPVFYQPSSPHKLDIEVLHSTTLKKKLLLRQPNKIERLNFYLLLFFTEGECRHMVDFEWLSCEKGSLLILQPGQIHQFDLQNEWQSWVVIINEDFLAPDTRSPSGDTHARDYSIQNLANHLRLTTESIASTSCCIQQMLADSQLNASSDVLHSLIQRQLQALIIRLNLLNNTAVNKPADSTTESLLHRQFQNEVENNFHRQLRITDYAKRIGCSEKSLYRAVQENTQVSPKKYLSNRIALEAKRLLAHTNQRVSLISHQLGFDEPTNFSKFFARQVGLTPIEFRAQYHRR